MRWNVLFAEPFALNDGRRIDSLGDAQTLIRTLPKLHQRRPSWRRAGELIHKAAEQGAKTAVLDARAQLELILKAEGLIR